MLQCHSAECQHWQCALRLGLRSSVGLSRGRGGGSGASTAVLLAEARQATVPSQTSRGQTPVAEHFGAQKEPGTPETVTLASSSCVCGVARITCRPAKFFVEVQGRGRRAGDGGRWRPGHRCGGCGAGQQGTDGGRLTQAQPRRRCGRPRTVPGIRARLRGLPMR